MLVASGEGVRCPFANDERHGASPYDDSRLFRVLDEASLQLVLSARKQFAEGAVSKVYEARTDRIRTRAR